MAKTNTVKPLELVNLIDPRLECMDYAQQKLEWGVPKGASYSNFVQQKANSYSQSGLSFNFNTQGENTMIDRRIYCKCQFQVSITGVPANGARLVNPNLSAPRSFPLASVVESLTLGINGASVNVSYADALQAMLRYNSKYHLSEYDLSGTPTMLDNYAEYTDAVGSIRNPLNDYGNSGYEQGRGCFKLDSITGNNVGDGVATHTAVIKFTVVEPLMISPLLYNSCNLESALIGVNNMSIQLNFGGNLDRVWSHAVGSAGETISSVSTVIGSGITEIPELLITYLNTPLVDESKIPREAIYDYFRMEVFQNDQNTTLNSGASQSFTNNSIQLSVVPKSIWIYVAQPRGSKTYADTDTYFRINSLSLQYLNVAGQFSSMNANDLYNLSVKNGCQMSFQEFNGESTNYINGNPVYLTGSVIRIDATDLALPSNLSAGCIANSQLQFTINITNTSGSSRQVSIYTLIGQEGLMTIADGSMMTQLGVVSQQDVLEARASKPWRKNSTQQGLYGGSFWDKIKSFGKNLIYGIDKALPVVQQALPVVQSLVGKGAMIGGEKPKRGRKGGALVGGEVERKLLGGKQLSRAELKKLLE